MVIFRDVVKVLRELGMPASQPVIVHASLSAVGEIRGGADTIVGALLSATQGVMAPTFTYNTMLTPMDGPADNAMVYGTDQDQNLMAEVFSPNMPADKMMGILPETLRRHPAASRSMHPILSYAGVGVQAALDSQTIIEPLAPIATLTEMNGWALLIGVNHTCNTSIHLGEKLAWRKQFVRFALTRQGVKECPGFSGCSDGFEAAAPLLQPITRFARLGNAEVRLLPLSEMICLITELIREQPDALLCGKETCERCNAVRKAVKTV